MQIYNSASDWNPQGTVWSEQFGAIMTRLITTAR
jgi:hypothetical protein